jgi:hypothetical protein
LFAWIRIWICIPNADPDPGGLKRAKMKKKMQIIMHKKKKSSLIFALFFRVQRQ